MTFKTARGGKQKLFDNDDFHSLVGSGFDLKVVRHHPLNVSKFITCISSLNHHRLSAIISFV